MFTLRDLLRRLRWNGRSAKGVPVEEQEDEVVADADDLTDASGGVLAQCRGCSHVGLDFRDNACCYGCGEIDTMGPVEDPMLCAAFRLGGLEAVHAIKEPIPWKGALHTKLGTRPQQ